MGTCKILLHVSRALHAVVESFELRPNHEGLVAQMNAIVNVRHQNKICNAWFGAQEVESVVIQVLSKNFKLINELGNPVSAVARACKAFH